MSATFATGNQRVFQTLARTGSILTVSALFLTGCKSEEISITHTASRLVEQNVMGVRLAGCDVFFEVNNGYEEKISSLRFEIAIGDPNASEEPLFDMHTGKWTGGPYRTEKLRFRDLPSGTKNVATRTSEGACDPAYVVKIASVSCMMGEDDCSQAVVIGQ
jgi:hypothetical protein